jgi:ABC-type sugar transport system substrate-binding protein
MSVRSLVGIGTGILVAVCVAAGVIEKSASAVATNGTIGVSMPNIKGPWFTPELFGISDEAHKLGYDVNIQDAGGYANVDKQVTQLSDLVVQKVKAILLDPADPSAFNGAVRQVKEAHIPIVGAGTPHVASSVPADGAVSSSHCNIGRELAKGAKALLPKGGSIAVLAGPPGAFWSSERLRCFKEDLAGSRIKIIAEQTSEQDIAAALSLANDFMQRHPDVDLMYGADDTYGVGIARAAQGAGKCGKVKVLFAVLGEQAEEVMKAGCADFIVAQQPVLIGRLIIRMADDLIKGKQLSNKLVDVPLIDVTPANLGAVDKTTMQAPKGWTPGS